MWRSEGVRQLMADEAAAAAAAAESQKLNLTFLVPKKLLTDCWMVGCLLMLLAWHRSKSGCMVPASGARTPMWRCGGDDDGGGDVWGDHSLLNSLDWLFFSPFSLSFCFSSPRLITTMSTTLPPPRWSHGQVSESGQHQLQHDGRAGWWP